MAEIRKHDPVLGNAIAEAIRQAMGDPVRPNPPGQAPDKKPDVKPAQTTRVSLRIESAAANGEQTPPDLDIPVGQPAHDSVEGRNP